MIYSGIGVLVAEFERNSSRPVVRGGSGAARNYCGRAQDEQRSLHDIRTATVEFVAAVQQQCRKEASEMHRSTYLQASQRGTRSRLPLVADWREPVTVRIGVKHVLTRLP